MTLEHALDTAQTPSSLGRITDFRHRLYAGYGIALALGIGYFANA